jgi:hypothetical protein
MGRKRKYFSEDDKRKAQRKWQMAHYHRNAEEIKRKAREKYRKANSKEFYDKKVQEMYRDIE